MKLKILYYLRWILSAFIMLPLMNYLENIGFELWINLILGQSFGALIFWNIDKWIFNKEV